MTSDSVPMVVPTTAPSTASEGNGSSNSSSSSGGLLFVPHCGGVPSQQPPQPPPPRFCENHRSVENGDVDLDDASSGDSDSCSGNGSDPTRFWDLAVTIYLPVVAVWLRRGMFGSAGLVRSFVVGQLVRVLVTGRASEWLADRFPAWLHDLWTRHTPTIVSPSSSCGGGCGGHGGAIFAGKHGPDPHAWPPPALTALALLTVFTLVVHPDGLTWVVLGKLRDALYSVMSVLSRSLEFFVDDYGIVPTVVAVGTLAALVFLLFVVLRTLSPKEKRSIHHQSAGSAAAPPSSEKRKKKKRGNHPSRRHQNHGALSRTRPVPDADPADGSSMGDPPVEASATTFPPATPAATPSAATTASTIVGNVSSSNIVPQLRKETLRTPAAVPRSPSNAAGEGTRPPQQLTISPARTTETNSGAVANSKRNRIASVSTLDTAVMTDDQSCGSTSVRSYPSVSVGSTRSADRVAPRKKNQPKPSSPSSSSSANGKSAHRIKRAGGKASNNNRTAFGDPPVSSRWDSLKPDHIGNFSNHAHGVPGSNGNHFRGSHHSHYQQNHGGRISGRRAGGNSSHGGGKNGRPPHSTAPPPASDSLFSRPPGATSFAPSSSAPSPPTSVNRFGRPFDGANPATGGAPVSTPPPGFRTDDSPSRQGPAGRPAPQWEDRTIGGSMTPTGVSFDGFSPDRGGDGDFMSSLLDDARIFAGTSTCQSAHLSDFFASPVPDARGGHFPLGGTTSATPPTIQENPFSNTTTYLADLDSQIEAELQELGGQMAGSILDF